MTRFIPDNTELWHHAVLLTKQKIIYEELIELATLTSKSGKVPLENITALAAYVELARDVRQELLDNVERVNRQGGEKV